MFLDLQNLQYLTQSRPLPHEGARVQVGWLVHHLPGFDVFNASAPFGSD